MPKDYQVNGTTYSFPDSYDDEKVKGILTKQGIIKPPPTQNPEMGFGQRMVQTGVGMAKGLGNTMANIGSVVTRPFEKDPKATDARQAKLFAPSNPSQKAGYGAEQVLEYVAP